MKTWVVFAGIILIFAINLSFAEAPTVPDKMPTFTPEEQGKLDAGKPVKRSETFDLPGGGRGGRGVAYIKIKATPEEIFHTILDYDKYVEFYPHVAASERYNRESDLYFAKFTLKLAGIISVTYHCRHVYNSDENWITWQLDPEQENDIKVSNGFWKIWKLNDNESLLAYSIFVDSGMKLPGVVEKIATGYGLRSVAECMKKRVESGGTYKR